MAERPSLFRLGNFTLASGERTSWKIECGVLTAGDWDALAVILASRLPSFAMVVGVPTGGLAFAKALQLYCGPGGRLLVVDDVWTTGESMRRFIGENVHRAGRDILRAVAFARNPPPDDVMALFTLAPVMQCPFYVFGQVAHENGGTMPPNRRLECGGVAGHDGPHQVPDDAWVRSLP